MRLLTDEMYPQALADTLVDAGVDTVTVASLAIRGAPDSVVFAAGQSERRTILTENVADFTQLAATCVTSGQHHHGLLIALSSRFSRRPEGIDPLAAAIRAVAEVPLEDRVIYLQHATE